MRTVHRLAIALCLTLPAAPSLAASPRAPQQDPAPPANSSGQAAPTPATPTPTPQENAPEQKSQPEAVPENPQAPTNEGASQTPAEKKTTAAPPSATKKRRKRPAPPPDGTTPQKVVVREGGAREPAAQIAPGLTPEEATHERRNAERWLGLTDDQLKQLADRPLDARKHETVGQIRNYMDGARSALKEGDVRRASTLAQKAHLLSEDLIKH